MKRGQRVIVHSHTVGTTRHCVEATFLRLLRDGRRRCRDNSGVIIDVDPGYVYPSQEAFEAAIPGLRVSVNTETGRITRFTP